MAEATKATEATVPWRIGEVIDGRYEVTAVHEQGGMGLVYRVRHLAWDIDLAVKSPRPELFSSPEDQPRFIAEAETWVSLGPHPHICNCCYVRVLDGVPGLLPWYVPGGGEVTWMAGPVAGAALAGYRADSDAGELAIPPALGDLLERCLRQNPAERPGSMAGIATELIGIYQGVTGNPYPRPAPATTGL